MFKNEYDFLAFVGVIMLAFIAWMGYLEYLQHQHRYRIGPNGPTREQVQKWLEENNNSAPPKEWYPNGDPWRNLTAEEVNEMFKEQDK